MVDVLSLLAVSVFVVEVGTDVCIAAAGLVGVGSCATFVVVVVAVAAAAASGTKYMRGGGGGGLPYLTNLRFLWT